ncbi:Sugar kinase of the NBD/HSP70 family, may contain an N-terminal HTH domain [Actinokineospora alba]|uniref:Sugar kinase of the NBD/HSP70 family, may contain an N-terminal HTH domain n=1 Tax=Actinokineospora alba TaxID=504798 RepID=A0A1H0I6P1_9PSEU|nr:ROK family transcriptional regulator [Actinokineospora alba]TDP64580.1 putative NBD/HSP70 family sugar kinase [Actinokineospora alba]SDI86762.1 Sugar kinase of the NBD/HSP70 family, may contain an N-terminal HTH domain [Actinokineospora alba]SDO27033.1 Sugar kinase of the NBD/HSP70 family, may contain an N-terminal HTH domain [Actinokineospora alba]
MRMTRADVPVPLVRSGEVASRTAIRRANLGLVLRDLNTHGSRSQTQLAEDLGLPKATVSTLVSELIELDLVYQTDATRAGAVGRPRQTVELRGTAFCGLGVEIAATGARAVALDLRDDVLHDHAIAFDRADPDTVLAAVAGLIDDALTVLGAAGSQVLGVTIAAPGQMDRDTGVIRFAAPLGWSEVALVAGLTERLPANIPPILIDNDARLGAVAEYAVARAEGIHDLLYVTGGLGVGAGILVDGQILRGAMGFAGEIGHLPLGNPDLACPCGRNGCVEATVAVTAFLDAVADPPHDLRDLEQLMTDLRARADAGDPAVLAALGMVGQGLGVVVGMLIDVLSPRAVILGGYFSYFGDHLLTHVRGAVEARAIAGQAGGCEIRTSGFGFTGPARGAAHTALEAVFTDPVACMERLSK